MGLASNGDGLGTDLTMEETTKPGADIQQLRDLLQTGLKPVIIDPSGSLVVLDRTGQPFNFTFIKYTLGEKMIISDTSLPDDVYINGVQVKSLERQNLALSGLNMQMRKSFALSKVSLHEGVQTYFFVVFNGKYFVGSIETLRGIFNLVSGLVGIDTKVKMDIIGTITNLMFQHIDVQEKVIGESIKREVDTPNQPSKLESEALTYDRLKNKFWRGISAIYFEELKAQGETLSESLQIKVSQARSEYNWMLLASDPQLDIASKPTIDATEITLDRVNEDRYIIVGSSPLQLIKQKGEEDHAIMVARVANGVAPVHGRFKVDTLGDVTFECSDGAGITHRLGRSLPSSDSTTHILGFDENELFLRITVTEDKIIVKIESEES